MSGVEYWTCTVCEVSGDGLTVFGAHCATQLHLTKCIEASEAHKRHLLWQLDNANADIAKLTAKLDPLVRNSGR